MSEKYEYSFTVGLFIRQLSPSPISYSIQCYCLSGFLQVVVDCLVVLRFPAMIMIIEIIYVKNL